ncbi:hypothetical protein BOX15_Mlig024300g3, partial [Macrostomum lignano]
QLAAAVKENHAYTNSNHIEPQMSVLEYTNQLAQLLLTGLTSTPPTEPDKLKDSLKSAKSPSQCSADDRKSALDQAFRDCARSVAAFTDEAKRMSSIGRLVDLSVRVASREAEDMCSASLPFLILSDVFELTPISECERVFGLLEDRVSDLSSPALFTSGKSLLLRMCNDLLRRLSKSRNTVFCGRIQLFFSRLFPLDDKSGINFMSHFNADFVNYAKSAESEPAGSGHTAFYMKFWTLQQYFRQPALCYQAANWSNLCTSVDTLLDTFAGMKIEAVRDSSDQFYPYYLTSQRLLDLQLLDHRFRRALLVQLLVLLQYLVAHVKFKSADQQLKPDQADWVAATKQRAFAILRETPPDAEEFAKLVEHVLEREELWSQWKNDSCPSIVRDPPADEPEADKLQQQRAGRKRRPNVLVDRDGHKLFRFANPRLTQLWRLCPDNMEAAKDREFTPELQPFFADAIDEADPEQLVEEQYKRVNSESWAWCALRLLSRKSPYFFQNQAQGPSQVVAPGRPLREYLDNILTHLARDFNSSAASAPAAASSDTPVESTTPARHQNGNGNGNEDEEDSSADLISVEVISQMAEALGSRWRELGTELGLPTDQLDSIADECAADSQIDMAVAKVLKLWTAQRPDNGGDIRSELLLVLGKFKGLAKLVASLK